MGWTSIYQLSWGSLGTRVLTHSHVTNYQRIPWISRCISRFGDFTGTSGGVSSRQPLFWARKLSEFVRRYLQDGRHGKTMGKPWEMRFWTEWGRCLDSCFTYFHLAFTKDYPEKMWKLQATLTTILHTWPWNILLKGICAGHAEGNWNQWSKGGGYKKEQLSNKKTVLELWMAQSCFPTTKNGRGLKNRPQSAGSRSWHWSMPS